MCLDLYPEKKQGGVTSMPPVVTFAVTIKFHDQEITDNYIANLE